MELPNSLGVLTPCILLKIQYRNILLVFEITDVHSDIFSEALHSFCNTVLPCGIIFSSAEEYHLVYLLMNRY